MSNHAIPKSIGLYFRLTVAVVLGLVFSGRPLADTIVPVAPKGDHVRVIDVTAATAEVEALRNEVTRFLRGKYRIQSETFYRFRGDVPWVAISKNVQNQMAEKSIQRAIYDWNNPGYDFVDVYPQGDGAFAVAMSAKGDASHGRLVGYFVLSAK